MKLTLRELAPYLPYELRIFHSDFMFRSNWNENEIGTMVGITDVVELDVLGETTFDIVMRRDKDFYKLHDSRGHFKPILRPLSDLTKEIEHNGEKFIPYTELYKIKMDVEVYKPINFDHPIELLINTDDYSQEIDLYNGYIIIQKLLEWHFDVFRLIEKSLAIDMNYA